MITCYKCRKGISEIQKIGFKDECPHCGIDLHSCVGCRHYLPGKPNDCNVPGTDFVRDRETRNFCEEFAMLEKLEEKSSKEDALKKFNSLFKE